MTKSILTMSSRWIAAVGAAMVLALQSLPASAGAQFQIPEEDPWAPIYARFLYTDYSPEWVVLYLYRERQCVPDDFNLLLGFDLTFMAFECPMLMTGTVVYNEATDFANGRSPRHASLHNIAGVSVPTLFIPIDDWMAAAADNVVTLPEAEAIPSALRGWARFHKEVLHPSATPAGGGAQVPKWNYKGHGTLIDGRSFKWHASGQFRDGVEHEGTFSVTIR